MYLKIMYNTIHLEFRVFMLQVTNLSRVIDGKDILKNINLTVNANKITVILGPSGSGKTTLIRVLSKLDPLTSGHVLINDQPLATIENWKLGMVFQNFNLFPHMTILENLVVGPMQVLKQSHEAAAQTAMELLAEFDLADKANELPKSLSGGQKQRVAIARCLMMDPPVIFMDEPTSALDPEMVSDVSQMIGMLKNNHRTIIVISHEIRLAKLIADDIIFMNQGCVTDHLPRDTFFDGGDDVSIRAREYLKNYMA